MKQCLVWSGILYNSFCFGLFVLTFPVECLHSAKSTVKLSMQGLDMG